MESFRIIQVPYFLFQNHLLKVHIQSTNFSGFFVIWDVLLYRMNICRYFKLL